MPYRNCGLVVNVEILMGHDIGISKPYHKPSDE
jgi:hypothetical protein